MAIPSVGSSGVNKTADTGSVQQPDSQVTQPQPQDSSPQTSELPLSEAGKSQKLQESALEGQTKRTQLEGSLDSAKAKTGPDAKESAQAAKQPQTPPLDKDQLAKMNNDELLKLAESPGGEEKLKQAAQNMKKDGLTADELKQMERIDSATMKEGAGLMLHGTPEDKQKFLHMTRKAMLDSPSFREKMNVINNDPLSLTQIELTRGKGDKDTTRLASFSKFNNGKQTIDMNDLEKFPEKPDPKSPEGITRGSVLVHEMVEARQGALEFKEPTKRDDQMKMYHPAHKEGVQAENDYRKDIGQTSKRKMPPNDVTRTKDEIIAHFDDGRDVHLKFKDAELVEIQEKKKTGP